MNIQYIARRDYEKVRVKVSLDPKEWQQIKRTYKTTYAAKIAADVASSHDLNSDGFTIDDSSRARRGVKYVYLTFQDTKWRDPSEVVPEIEEAAETLILNEFSPNVIKVDFKNKCRAA